MDKSNISVGRIHWMTTVIFLTILYSKHGSICAYYSIMRHCVVVGQSLKSCLSACGCVKVQLTQLSNYYVT